MISLTEENYLKAIFHLKDADNRVTVNDISRLLQIKMPSVNSMMKKFAARKWVIYESYKPIRITASGFKQAALIVRKHRLTEMYLVEKMHFGWEDVHEIAEQLEHVKSEKFFDKMDQLLNHPTTDPHGEPIPDKDGNIIAQNLRKLSLCRPGAEVIFSAVTESDDVFLKFLNSRNLELGQKFMVLNIEDFDQSMTLLCEGEEKILSHKVTEKLLVKE